MGKILDSEFRKVLYKNLIDGGYSKEEAQKIVGKKYYEELHSNTLNEVNQLLSSIMEERFDVQITPGFNEHLAELKKLKEILG